MAKDSVQLAVKPLTLKAGEISAVLIKLAPGANAEQVAAAIETAVPNAHVVTSAYLAREVSNQLSGTIGSLYLMAGAVTLGLGAIGRNGLQHGRERAQEGDRAAPGDGGEQAFRLLDRACWRR